MLCWCAGERAPAGEYRNFLLDLLLSRSLVLSHSHVTLDQGTAARPNPGTDRAVVVATALATAISAYRATAAAFDAAPAVPLSQASTSPDIFKSGNEPMLPSASNFVLLCCHAVPMTELLAQTAAERGHVVTAVGVGDEFVASTTSSR